MYNIFQIKIFRKPLIGCTKFSFRDSILVAQCYPVTTWKKKLVRLYIFLNINLLAIGMKSFFGKKVSSKIQQSINSVTCLFKFQSCVVVWPNNSNRGRLYIHLFDKSGNKIVFGKIALDSENSHLISNEYNVICKLLKKNDLNFDVPKILAYGDNKQGSYICVEPMPTKAKIYRPLPESSESPYLLVKNLSKTCQKIKPIDLAWFDTWVKKKPDCYKIISNFISDLEIHVSFCHGDLGSENIFRHQKVIIIDWEQSSPHGPIAVDMISYYLGYYNQKIKKQPSYALDILNEIELNISWINKSDILFALIYLDAKSFNIAGLALSLFVKTNEINNFSS